MRMSTGQLRATLANWSASTNMIIGDMYTFTMITGETFWFSNLGVPVMSEVPGGRIGTSAPTPPGSSIISVSGLSFPMSRWMIGNEFVINLSNPASLPTNTQVSAWSDSSSTITMNQDAIGSGISTGDNLSLCYYYDFGPRFSRSKVKTQIGPQIDEMEVDMLVGGDDYIALGNTATMTWQEAIFHGLFDGGYCKLDRAFFTTHAGDPRTLGTCQGSVCWFYGRLSDITVGRTKITIKVKSLLDLLTIQMPRRLYQASCGWIFGAPGCDYDRSNGKNANGDDTGIGRVSIAVIAGSDKSHLVFDTGAWTPNPTDIYDNGTMISTSGQNHGYMRTIGLISGNTIYYLKPWIFPVNTGDTFDLLPGCNHTQSRCGDFNNTARYGGFPYIPPPETAV